MIEHKGVVVVTGVSTGIGYALVEKLTFQGYTVFGSVRTESDANRLQRKFGERYHPLIFDICDHAAIEQAAALVRDYLNGQVLVALVNNAGIAMSGPLEFFSIDRFRMQFEVNVVGLLKVTQFFLPLLGAGQTTMSKGKIINISSVSGIFTIPFMGPYSASKFALESLCDAMRREFSLYGIQVVSIIPGPIQTEIWNKAKNDTTDYPLGVYDSFLKNRIQIIDKRCANAKPADYAAGIILKVIEHAKPKTRYRIGKRKWIFTFLNLLPDKWADALIIRVLRRS
jgi:short-subunit dehydrogenase